MNLVEELTELSKNQRQEIEFKNEQIKAFESTIKNLETLQFQSQSENAELIQDIKSIKEPIVMLCKLLTFINEDETVNKDFRVGKLISKLSRLVMNPKALEKDFGFLQTLYPLFEKYKDL